MPQVPGDVLIPLAPGDVLLLHTPGDVFLQHKPGDVLLPDSGHLQKLNTNNQIININKRPVHRSELAFCVDLVKLFSVFSTAAVPLLQSESSQGL